MKIKKIACLLMAFAMIWMTASCRVSDGNVTDLTDPTGIQQTVPDDSGSNGPSKPEPTAPTEPEPTDPADPSEPTEPADPTVPTEPVHEHSYSEEVTKPTCTENGFTTFTCECGDSYEAYPTVPTGHSWSDWVTTKEPTEAATGTAQRICSGCGEKENRVLDKIIPDHTHSYTGKVTTAATCTKEGVKTYTCSCGGSYTEKISKISHSYKDTVTKPTCTEKGYTTHKCSACGDSYKDSYIAATGHSYGSYKSNGDATCTKDGTKTATCSKCGVKDTKTDTGSAKGHSYKDTVTAPTCSSEGYTTHTCSTCGDSYKDGYTSAANHNYLQTGSALNNKYELSYQYQCSACGYLHDEQVKLSEDELQAYYREVQNAIVKYINQFRVEQGDTEAISLPGLTLVAEYRAVQLQDNFRHSFADSREAFAHYQYGEYVDATEYGDDASNSYWTANAKEAIAKCGGGIDADALAESIARQFLTSANHWAYVGSSEYSYIGVGVSYRYGAWYTCVLQTKVNYG